MVADQPFTITKVGMYFFNVKTKIMQKSVHLGHKKWLGTLLKTLLVMKLVMVILLVTALQVKATPSMGQLVTLKATQTEIKKVLKAIEADGHYRFLYNSELKGLKNKVDFNAQSLSITQSLNNLFAGTNLTFKQLNNNLIVVLSTNEAENAIIKVTGKVTGENGEALAGASVQEKGTSNGTFTDNNGNFTLTESGANHFRHYSRFGMGNDVADYNNDGQLDIVTVYMLPSDEKTLKAYGSDENADTYKVKLEIEGYQQQSSKNCLQRNNGNGVSFSETSLMSSVAATD